MTRLGLFRVRWSASVLLDRCDDRSGERRTTSEGMTVLNSDGYLESRASGFEMRHYRGAKKQKTANHFDACVKEVIFLKEHLSVA